MSAGATSYLRSLATLVLATALAAVGVPAAAGAEAHTLTYHGYRIAVPAGWPVFRLSQTSTTCVRFNRHALYLGAPSTHQVCPAHAAGRTEAILVEPLPAPKTGVAQLSDGRSRQFTIAADRVRITATWATRPQLVAGALHVRSLSQRRSVPAAAAVQPARPAREGPRATTASVYTGLGFDACSAPTTSQMSAWRKSPFHAVGVYIGGTNMACTQASLTPAWVTKEIGAGWHLILTYVGLQAPSNICGCAAIVPQHAKAEGTAAAIDAVNHAQALGLGTGNPIYDDMEYYATGGTNTSAVLAFLGAWTKELHALGYVSGVYTSSSGGVKDLVAKEGTTFPEPDDIWVANWNGSKSTSDPAVPSGDWANHQRLHQYSGSLTGTYGGVTMNVDGDYLDGATADNAATLPDGTFIQVTGQSTFYEIVGGAPLYVSDWTAFGGPQPYTVVSQQVFDSLRPLPADGTFVTTSTGAIYRIAGGAPVAVSTWTIFGGTQPSLTIDQWDIDNISNPAAHLNAHPANGSIVEGLPSQTYWKFWRGLRKPATATAGALPVDDVGLEAFAIAPPPRCVVPALRHLTLPQARHALHHAHCQLGRVRQPRHVPALRAPWITRQSARPQTRHAARFVVNVRLG